MRCVSTNDIELINTLLAAITLIVACVGVGAWRTQLKGTFVFSKKREIISELRKYKILYHESLHVVRFYQEIIDEQIDKKVILTNIINPMKEHNKLKSNSLESIKSLLLEISPINKKIDKKWSLLNLRILVSEIFYDSLISNIENDTDDKMEENIQRILDSKSEEQINQEIDKFIRLLEHY